jgi:hypothetical protein
MHFLNSSRRVKMQVCAVKLAMELVSSLWVNSCCGNGWETVREPRKGNAHRLKPVPEDWWRVSRPRRLTECCSELHSVWNSNSATVIITYCKNPINPVTNTVTSQLDGDNILTLQMPQHQTASVSKSFGHLKHDVCANLKSIYGFSRQPSFVWDLKFSQQWTLRLEH